MADKASWKTEDEIKVITYIGSASPRVGNGSIPTDEERKQKLHNWLETSTERAWPAGFDLPKCQAWARYLIGTL